ncbi:DUF1365 domain-containing protein [Yinghuangia sp. KLBMP8922]|uniref:DUF1365 domain-containing protein n=1 Tax=Yinghuangia soli TaxID=2908204 RepID=A0AA41QAV8_9ACTN|nr:DUF1365 domain-containing protein [Yinghuangia soli]MCF2533931.1 DUF1365 domain-containing protein [Yinghuangia soli]
MFDTEVVHVRKERFHRAFRARGYTWLVDLDHPPELPRWLRPFARFEARDHMGDPALPIRANVEAWLAARGIDVAGGRILMLANARVLGYVFNPLTLYWCHHRDGTLACVIAEVHNTYGEHHPYLLHPDPLGRARTAKAFYVSPFLEVDGDYDMRVPEPGARLDIAVTLRRGGRVAFTALWRGRRRPANTGQFLRVLVRHPLMPHQVTAGIRRHGIALWLRRVPVVPRGCSRQEATPWSTSHAPSPSPARSTKSSTT